MAIESINKEICTGCGLCVNVCPMDVIRMDKELEKAVIQYPDDCMLCEFCALDCPEAAITITPEKNSKLMVSWG